MQFKNTRLTTLAPRNPTQEDLTIHMAGKHRELRGFLCPYDESIMKEWTETCSKSGVTIYTHNVLSKFPTVTARRIEFTINAPVEKIVSVAGSCKTFFTMTAMFDNVEVIEKMGEFCVCYVRGLKPSPSEIPREALLVCSNCEHPSRNYTTVIHTSVESTKAPVTPEGSIRNYVDICGMLIMPTGKAGVTKVSGVTVCDTGKAWTSESLKNLDNLGFESAMKLKQACEGSM